jgi:hypothetical protein
MLIKDLFNETLRRLEWSKDRNLEPVIIEGSSGIEARFPVDKTLAYVIKIDEIAGKGALIKSFFPDGDPHHCIGIPGVSSEEAASIIKAAALIVFGRLPASKEEKKAPR